MDVSAMLRAQAEAREMRGVHLTSIREGFLAPEEVIDLACRDGYEPLRKIKLMNLLMAMQGFGEVSASRLLNNLISASGQTSVCPSETTVAWLIDRRACGRRLVIWANLRRPHESPWPGFPFTPKTTRKVEIK